MIKEKIRKWLEIPEPFKPAEYWNKEAVKLAKTAHTLETLYLGSSYDLYIIVNGKSYKIETSRSIPV